MYPRWRDLKLNNMLQNSGCGHGSPEWLWAGSLFSACIRGGVTLNLIICCKIPVVDTDPGFQMYLCELKEARHLWGCDLPIMSPSAGTPDPTDFRASLKKLLSRDRTHRECTQEQQKM
jgi:hypothetical protein